MTDAEFLHELGLAMQHMAESHHKATFSEDVAWGHSLRLLEIGRRLNSPTGETASGECGECRYFVPFGTPHPEADCGCGCRDGTCRVRSVGNWPVRRPDEWCGEFRAKEREAAEVPLLEGEERLTVVWPGKEG